MKIKLIQILGAMVAASSFGQTQPAFNKPPKRHKNRQSETARSHALAEAEAKRERRAARNRRSAAHD